jgi:queuosine precursor transporter
LVHNLSEASDQGSIARDDPDQLQMVQTMMGVGALLGYIATIPLANWLIVHVGTYCIPDGPCVVPVWPGVYCPSGSLMIGWTLVLRDIVQRAYGSLMSLGAIAVGIGVSGMIAPPALVWASMIAFTISELTDWAVYTPLYRKRFIFAVWGSALVGLVVDSFLFLKIAFGSVDLLPGIVLGKIWMVLIALPFMFYVRSYYARRAA